MVEVFFNQIKVLQKHYIVEEKKWFSYGGGEVE